MSSIDRRIVEMKFNNAQFNRGITETSKALDVLKKALNLDDAKNNINELDEAGKRFSLSGMADAVDNISSKFSILGAIGFAAIQKLTHSAIDFGTRIAGALLDPLIEGGKKRALNIEQARFQFEGLGMDIEKTMGAALEAVKGTAFGLDEAAVAAASLGASQVPLDEMAVSLRAISGVAAMAGSSYSDVADVFTKVAGQGRLMGDDLLRLSSRGINAAATLAKSMGKTEEEVRKMVTAGEIDFKTFSDAMDDAFGEHATKANQTFTGSLSNMRAALSRIGAAFWTPALEQSRDLFNALTPVIDDVASALEPVIELFTELAKQNAERAVKFLENLDLTGLQKALPHVIDGFKTLYNFVKNVLGAIKDGFTTVFPPKTAEEIEAIGIGIKNFLDTFKMAEGTVGNLRRTFAGFFAVIGIGWEVVKRLVSVLAEVFGYATKGSGGILDFTASLGDWLVALHEAIRTGDGLNKFFDGLKRVLKVPIDLIGGLVAGLGALVQAAGQLSPAPLIEFADRVRERLQPLSFLGDMVAAAWTGVVKAWGAVAEFFAPMASTIARGFEQIQDVLSSAMSSGDFQTAFDLLNTGILAGIAFAIQRFFKKITDAVSDGGGILSGITGVLDGVTGSLQAMQQNLKADTLIKIAGALALLTVSVVALSLIDSERLTSSLTAMAVMFTQLMVTMAIFEKISMSAGFVKMPLLAAAMILLATAITILSAAVTILSKLDWNELAKGLTGVTVLIGVLVAAAKGLSGVGPSMIAAGIGMIALSTGLLLLSKAVERMAQLSWHEMARGMAGVAGGLVIIAGAMRIMPKGMGPQAVALGILAGSLYIFAAAVKQMANIQWDEMGRGAVVLAGGLAIIAGAMHIMPKGMIAQAAGLLVVGAALQVLSGAMKSLGGMSWEEIGKGLVVLAGSLVLIAAAMLIMPPTMIITAAGLLVVAAALTVLAGAMQSFGSMSWAEIGKSMVMLAGSLILIAAAMYVMVGALPGAAALIVVATALSILAPVMQAFGGMSWEEIGKGLLMLGATLGVLALAGLALTPVIPTLMGLGIALALIGVGVLAAGVGVLAFATGLTALAVAGAGATTALVGMVTALLGLIPMAMTKIGEGIVAMAGVITAGAPAIVEAIVAVIGALLGAVTTLMPQIKDAFVAVITAFLDAINELSPQIQQTIVLLLQLLADTIVASYSIFVDAGLRTLIGILDGIANNIGRVIDAGVRVITEFLAGIDRAVPTLIQAGANTIINFVNSLADGIRNNQARMTEAGQNLASAIIDGMTGGLYSRVGSVISAAADVAASALNSAKSFLGINSPSKEFHKLGSWSSEGMSDGLVAMAGAVGASAAFVGHKALDAMKSAVSQIPNLIEDDMDMNPRIRPVIDLSDVRRGAGEISSALDTRAMSFDMSRAKLMGIESDQRRAEEESMAEMENAPASVTNINYTQNNTSPKALTDSEIYRNTSNQLALVKEMTR